MPPDALCLQSVRKTFVSPHRGRTMVVDIEAFHLEHAGSLGLKGMSGSGKTTLLHLISGVLRPDAGVIQVAGVEISALSESRRDAARGRLIGYVFQTFNLLPGFTALENVTLAMALGRGADTARAKAMLDRVGMADRLDHYPAQLSSGQQQRVAVARALANRPALVLADEPTGALDPHHARQTLDLLREACAENDAALLLVSHDETALKAMPRMLDLAQINRASIAADAPRPADATAPTPSTPEPADA